MPLSINEAKFPGLRARNCATIQQVLIQKNFMPSDPQSYRAFRETGPWSPY